MARSTTPGSATSASRWTRARGRSSLDETLAIVDGLSSGEPFAFDGEHYRFGPMTFNPRPVQRPRIPVWVVGAWPHERSMRRAVRWDGLVVQALGPDGKPATGPDPLPEIVAWVRRERPAELRDRPFEIVVDGVTPADDHAAAARIARAHEEAGATWWIEADWSSTLDRRPARPHRCGAAARLTHAWTAATANRAVGTT